jgi:hypothetical protein
MKSKSPANHSLDFVVVDQKRLYGEVTASRAFTMPAPKKAV